jgi:hypothetical protein
MTHELVTCYYCHQELAERSTAQGRQLCDPTGSPWCPVGNCSFLHSTEVSETRDDVARVMRSASDWWKNREAVSL